MKNKLGLLLLQVVFVIGLVNAQNNLAYKIDNSLNDYEFEDEFIGYCKSVAFLRLTFA